MGIGDPQSNATIRFEWFGYHIPQHTRKGHCRYTCYYPINKSGMKTQFLHHGFQEIPFDTIKGFAYIQVKGHLAILPFPSSPQVV